jgi:putative Ca2+/H+ antiporter (TMEM165/GDT1 family)
LAVLPGEKVQFIIAGLSTRYNPYVVVAAAGSAFAGWTALEILFGNAIQSVLPAIYLEMITVALFFLFGVMLYRSAPSDGSVPTTTDGGFTELADGREISLFGIDLPKSVTTFVGIFSMMAVGEFGDKTQLITISLAIQYGATPAIWAGEMLAIIPVSLANALFFHRFAHAFNLRKAHFAGAAIFIFFALDTLLSVLTGVSVWETVVEGVASLLVAAL